MITTTREITPSAVDTPVALGHSAVHMLRHAVSVPVLVPPPAVATGVGIELIIVIPR